MNNMISEFLSVPPFEPRPTPSVVWIFDAIVMAPAFVVWGSGAYLVFQAFRGNWALLLLLPIWAAAVLVIARRLHIAGRIRLSVSLGSAATVLLATVFVCLTT